jgi:hypothetical protein
MMTYYEAKFAREAQEAPADWVIFPVGFERYKLVYIGPAPDAAPRSEPTVGEPTDVPYLRVVK